LKAFYKKTCRITAASIFLAVVALAIHDFLNDPHDLLDKLYLAQKLLTFPNAHAQALQRVRCPIRALETPPVAVGRHGDLSDRTLAALSEKNSREARVRLERIRGGRHDRYYSIVFQFSAGIDFDKPAIQGNEIHLRLKNVKTKERRFRKYKTFDSWLKLKEDGNDQVVHIGVPKNLMKLHAFLLKNPHRLVIHLYYQKGAAPSKSTKKTQHIQPPFPAHNNQISIDGKSGSSRHLKEASSEPLPATSPGTAPSLDDKAKQLDMIQARIFYRQGYCEKSLDGYLRLRKDYPNDKKIWEDYIETLAECSRYESALAEIEKMLREDRSNLQAQKIKARIYHERGKFSATFPVYESILSLHQSDSEIWSDYAYARLDAGDWAAALSSFSRVLELDPENQAALRSVHSILREHRPRLGAGYRFFAQAADDTRIGTLSLNYMRHVTENTKLDMGYDRISIDRPSGEGVIPVDVTINDLTLWLRHRLNRQWLGRLGGGVFSGSGRGGSFLVGLDYMVLNSARLGASYVLQRPWYYPVEAAALDGTTDRAELSFDWNFDRAWVLYLGLTHWYYYVDDRKRYGRENTFTGILTWTMVTRPNFSLSYSYYRSRFRLDDEGFAPVPMIEDEGVHSLSWSFEHWPYTYWGYSLSGGFRRDHIRSISSWYAIPGIRVRFGNRIECGLTYEFSSEALTVEGGRTDTIHFLAKIIW
jgi:tetratricopeptide (TPR) repeat protein